MLLLRRGAFTHASMVHRSRSGRAAALKTKNNLLASVLLLTALPSSVKMGQAVVEHACFLITQVALSDDSEVSPSVSCPHPIKLTTLCRRRYQRSTV